MNGLRRLQKRWSQLGKPRRFKAWGNSRVYLVAIGLTGVIAGLRSVGLFQAVELAAVDQLFRLRPLEAIDQRITIISISDQDINQIGSWPIPDAILAEVLKEIKSHQPRAIGLDLYRELPVYPGQAALNRVFETTPNLIGIQKIADDTSRGVQAPPLLLQQQQVGFNNVVVDPDGTVRRAVLFWETQEGHSESFALKLALLYLKQEGVTPSDRHGYLRLGGQTFGRLRPDDGSYVNADTGGYQIFANPRGPAHRFHHVALQAVLDGSVSPELLRDRIVLIGSTAVSLRDFFYTSYSSGINRTTQPISGVELHANFISQILSAALDRRPLLRVLPDPIEVGWIFVWSWLGAAVSWRVRSPAHAAILVLVASATLAGGCYLVFLHGWWIPLIPPMVALVGSTIAITGYLAHQKEELKKSKEFLNSIINTIPDPVFVKNRHHRWIVLNDAFCRLIGHPLEQLLDRSESNFFPAAQTQQFWQQDDLTFRYGEKQETEEEFTDARGVTYRVATKRSLHRDAAGNVFLVGVIRDITQRKQLEDELRRTAEELVRSNAELRQVENRLRYMALYDTLTGLPNRELLYERLHHALQNTHEHHQLVAVLFLDLDGFKQVNDTYGHLMGDLLLKAVAQRLTRCLRGSDTVARLGGDEFVVLLPAIPTTQDVARVAEKILQTLSQSFALEGYTIPMSTSIGISLYQDDRGSIETLLQEADLAMYQAKQMGKNCYQFAVLKKDEG
ncbi:MAG: CHASE2 domain-containing protein [Leptolyngbyaceae cyanobacterium SL_7_1]|nr:CHASE2 domain-containing protein [Leptolyngbyaceae cyanobacterium SL_7_1]